MAWIRRGLFAAVAVATTFTGLAGVLPGKAGAVSPLPTVGVQFHATWSDYTDAERITVLDRMAAANVRWVRIDIGWRAFEETGPGQISTYQTSLLDKVVTAAQARGVNVLGTLWRSPAWANGNQSATTPPNDPADYARFAQWIAAHYKGKIAAWEIWNEPNSNSFFVGADPARYAALVRAAYPAFKAGDPDAKVVIGSVQQNDAPWLGRMFDAGVAGAFDVVSTHPYQGPSNAVPEVTDDGHIWVLDHIGAVRSLMVNRGFGDKNIWATEFGWSSHANTGTEPTWKLGVTEAQQADYYVRALNWFANRHPYVTNVFWYNERNKATGDAQEDNYGLLYRDLTPKPVYNAIKSLLAPTSTTTSSTSTTSSTTSTTVAPTTTTSTTVAPAPSTTTTTAAPAPAPSTTTTTAAPAPKKKKGYTLIASDGRVYSFAAASTGSVTNFNVAAGHRIVSSTGNAEGTGTWSVTDDGAVFTTGSATWLGAMNTVHLNKPIVGIAATPSGKGYWLVASDGGIFGFGDAGFFGSTGGIVLNKPIVGMAATPSGRGYWLVATDGGIFSFGDAVFRGSTGSIKLNQPIVGMAPTGRGDGYWMVAADGGIFAFNAPFLGSTGSASLNRPIVGMVSTASGNGYWFAAQDGGIFAFGDAQFLGSAADTGATFTAMAPVG